ncbi:MAG: transporter substrate-binding domain-containing protein [Candidatus Krumholzibacteriia bacterium]|nr:transporter substrate-binding domain-containing protein [bacterium]MCB9514260.1 transporter substrate-binding domain-containing protein [Candidatus Latescibacterota bacterium]
MRRASPLVAVTAALLLALLPGWAGAQVASEATPPAPTEPLRVAVRVAPPFVVAGPDGALSGIAMELWQDVAGRLALPYRVETVGLDSLLAGTAAGRFDLGVGATTVTARREALLDFSHPFHSSGLGIATRRGGNRWLAVLSQIVSPGFLGVVVGLSLLLLLVGALVWWFERRANPEQFDARAGHGLAAGFWFAAVTMTTVGYGDKAPRSAGGRVVTLIWMFAAIVVISFFTAGLASSLTVNSLQAAVEGPEQLPRVRVATLPGSTSARWLDARGIAYTAADSLPQLVELLAAGRVDAAVYDAPILRWLVRQHGGEDLLVLPEPLERQDYAFALLPGSPWREPLNRALLEIMEQPAYAELLERYLGR